jgi:xylan 1,4-beta-xylosidase
MSCLPDSTQADAFTPPIAIPAGKPVYLRVEVDFERLHFAYRIEGVENDWRWLSQQFDASILSDEATAPGLSSFTGAFVGMACQDLAGQFAWRILIFSNTRSETIVQIRSRFQPGNH